MSLSLNVYHHLPYPLRVLAASIHGMKLSRWRYGQETDQLVAEALERDQWTPDKWKNWQEERLAFILNRAATRVPYYRDRWTERRRSGDRSSWEILDNWEVLKKEQIRLHPQAFLADDCEPRKMFIDHTGGTTGKPLIIWLSRQTVRQWYALFEARVRWWNGLDRHIPWAIIGAQLIIPYSQQHPPYWVWNAGLHQLYFSEYHLSPSSAPAYLEAMRRHSVNYLMGFASTMASLANIAKDQNLITPDLKVIFNNAEALRPFHRQAIEEVFKAPIRDTYGQVELGCAASECPHGTMHLWPEVGIVEAHELEVDEPLPVGIPGRLVCTSLINTDMPFIRYEVGDYGALAPQGTTCPCGRSLPVMGPVEGRTADLIITSTGRRIFLGLNTIFHDLPICEGQILQDRPDKIEVHIIPDEDFSPSMEKVMRSRLEERLGEMEVSISKVSSIPRGPNGKFRSVISRVKDEKRIEINTLL